MDIYNKRDSNMKEPSTNTQVNTTTNFITIVIYYIPKKLQLNFIFKLAHHKESLREDKVLKVMYKVFLFFFCAL